MMTNDMTGLYVVDGHNANRRFAMPSGVMRMSLDELPLETLPGGCIALLNLEEDELQGVLGAFFRQKRPFVLSGLNGMTSGELKHLVATVRKRKSHAWVLGGLRILPMVSAVKEIVSGGCLGQIREIEMSCGKFSDSMLHCRMMAWDAATWLFDKAFSTQEKPAVAVQPRGSKLEISAVGSAGKLHGEYDFACQSGCLCVVTGNHERQRQFGAAEPMLMELNLLTSLATGDVCSLPGIVPVKTLPDSPMDESTEN